MPSYSRPNYVVAFEPRKKPTPSAPWDCLPWTNDYWCQAQGFLPNGQGLASGFTTETMKQLSPAQLAHFSPQKIEEAKVFLLEVQKRYRENPQTVLIGIARIPGSTSFKNAMRVLIDRHGGTHELVWDAMVDKHATPTAALRDLRIRMEHDEEEFSRILFGESAINPVSKTLNEAYILPLQSFFTRTWEAKQDTVLSAIAQRDALPEDYQKSIDAATNKPTATRLMAACNSLRKWKETAEILGEIDSEHFKQQEELLATLWKSLGRTRSKSGAIIKNKATLSALCTQEELDAAYHHYLEIHFPQADALVGLLTVVPEEEQVTESLISDLGTDLGVEDMLGTSIQDLVKLIGLPDGSTQFPFGEPGPKHSGSATEHTPKATITPEWHQWVGASCLFRAWFTPALGEHPSPSMLCDGVGLGKTLQLVGAISLLVHHMERSNRRLEIPPLLSNLGKKYFAGLPDIPRLPHLIIVPPSLSIQWWDEIIRYIKHGSFQVLIYSRTRTPREQFFAPGGMWDRAVSQSGVAHRTIVIAESTTIAKEYEECCERHYRNKLSVQKARPQPLLPDCGPTIFEKQFAVGVVDEIHNFRNVNSGWEGVLKALDRCSVRIGATATPIYTSHNDLVSALRLLRYQPLIGDQGVAQGEAMEQMEKDAAKKWKDESAIRTFATILAKKRLEEDGHAPSEEDIKQTANTIIEQEHNNLRSFFVAYPVIQYVKRLLKPVIIRRDGRSFDPTGAKVVTLEPYIESVVSLVLRPDEMEAVAQIASRRPSAVTGKTGELAWVNFFLDYRFVTFDKRMLDRHNLPHIWNQWDRNDYEQEASTKLRCLINILQHHIEDKDAPPLFYDPEDGTLLQSDPPNLPTATRARKFIIFSMYQLPRLMIGKALELHAIQYREYDGTMLPPARNAALKEFEQNEAIVVLLMSNVGNVGLNITRASVLILVDQPWSFSELMQILGRLWRKGQLDVVLFYRLIALGTADTTMSCIATGKALMLEQLTSQDGILDCIHGRDQAVLDRMDDQEEPELTSQSQKRTKKASNVKPRPMKNPPRVVSDSVSEPEPSVTKAEPPSVTAQADPKASAQVKGKGKGKSKTEPVMAHSSRSSSLQALGRTKEPSTAALAPKLQDAPPRSLEASTSRKHIALPEAHVQQMGPRALPPTQLPAPTPTRGDQPPTQPPQGVRQDQIDQLKDILKSVDLTKLQEDPQFMFHLKKLGLSLPKPLSTPSASLEPVPTFAGSDSGEELQKTFVQKSTPPHVTTPLAQPSEIWEDCPPSSSPPPSPAEEFLPVAYSPKYIGTSAALDFVASDDETSLAMPSSGRGSPYSMRIDLSPPPSPPIRSPSKIPSSSARPPPARQSTPEPQSPPSKSPLPSEIGRWEFPNEAPGQTTNLKRKAEDELGGPTIKSNNLTSGTRPAVPIFDEDLTFSRNVSQLSALKKKKFRKP